MVAILLGFGLKIMPFLRTTSWFVRINLRKNLSFFKFANGIVFLSKMVGAQGIEP